MAKEESSRPGWIFAVTLAVPVLAFLALAFLPPPREAPPAVGAASSPEREARRSVKAGVRTESGKGEPISPLVEARR